MTLITFIRHSHTVIDPHTPNKLRKLSPDGIQRAHDLAKKQADTLSSIQRLYTSPQLKAVHTAAIIASHHPIYLVMEPGLDEVTSITKKRFDNFTETVQKFFHDPTMRINDGETTTEATHRFNTTLNHIVQQATQDELQHIGIVTHGTMLSLFAAQYHDQSPYDLHHHIAMPDTATFDRNTKNFTNFFGS